MDLRAVRRIPRRDVTHKMWKAKGSLVPEGRLAGQVRLFLQQVLPRHRDRLQCTTYRSHYDRVQDASVCSVRARLTHQARGLTAAVPQRCRHPKTRNASLIPG